MSLAPLDLSVARIVMIGQARFPSDQHEQAAMEDTNVGASVPSVTIEIGCLLHRCVRPLPVEQYVLNSMETCLYSMSIM